MKLFDLHSHTKYSFCGRDEPEALINAVIAGGIEILGISDHNYGIGNCKELYSAEIKKLAKKYKDKIKVLCGIEIATRREYFEFIPPSTARLFDYCLLEDIGSRDSLVSTKLPAYADSLGIPVGIAHTDMFAVCNKEGRDPARYFRELAKHGVFWEMNVSYDPTHDFREHAYVKDFFADSEKQKTVRDSGMCISVGFDGHRLEDYLPQRVIDACNLLDKAKIKPAYEIIIK